jgi:hypothetical protein
MDSLAIVLAIVFGAAVIVAFWLWLLSRSEQDKPSQSPDHDIMERAEERLEWDRRQD